ncbi:hypothetical protein [Motiliproteus sp.]|uniref:hypothetical protein n=1 Tax=Motiliproteus sp. TaxID=1898955 RepID=UPI003BA8A6C4
MTNLDLKRELDLVKQSLIDLQDLTKTDGVDAVTLESFITLIIDRYEWAHDELVSMLRIADLLEISKTEGKEAALAAYETWGQEQNAAH